ncbi:MFS general substrate transporter [Xylariomycetidae sp. FL2044]|nr:MFS general substrate transporter [Xylariomycetidae sp. FL2044]
MSPPDGGWCAWRQVAGSFLILFCSLGLGNSFGSFQAYYESHVLSSHTPADISWIGTVQGFLLSVAGLVTGVLCDRGYIQSLIAAGGLLCILGLVATSFADQYRWVFLAYGVCVGLGFGTLYTPALAIIQSYFTRKLPLATGIATTGASVGGIAYPVLFRYFVDTVGFPWGCRALAFINGGLLLLALFLIQPPEDVSQSHVSAAPKLPPYRYFCDTRLLLFGCCLFLLGMGLDVPFFFLPQFAMETTGSPALGDYFLSGLNGSTLLGRLLLGAAATYVGSIKVWQVAVLGASATLFCWITVTNLAGTIVFVIAYGFFIGGIMALITPSLEAVSSGEKDFGARLGLVEGFEGLGFLVGPPIAGALIETPARYLGVGITFGSLYFIVFVGLAYLTWCHGAELKAADPLVTQRDGSIATMEEAV